MTPDQVQDAAKKATAKIVADLTDRRGLRQEWEGIDDDIRAEIVAQWEAIIVREIEGWI